MQSPQEVADRNEDYRGAYEALGTEVLNLNDEIVESDLTKVVDFDGEEMQLFSYQYRMGSVEPFSVLVKKGSANNKLTAESYNRLLQMKHPLLLPVQNFYEKGSNYSGWFIFPPIQGSLEGWLKSDGSNLMFKGVGAKRNMAPLFRGMIIDIWSLVKAMSKKLLYPEEVKMEDFFVKILHGGAPRILMVLTQFRVKGRFTGGEQWERIWVDINALVDRCCQICSIQLSELSKSFCKYAQRCTHIRDIKNYPDNWTYDEKASYLYHLISGAPYPRHTMRSKINEDSGLEWPKGDDGRLLPVIQLILNLKCNIIEDDKGVRFSKYSTEKAYDYVQVFRNNHKHFDDLPDRIKVMLGGNRRGLIRCMETWEPRVWVMLYEAVGPAGSQRG